MDILNVLANEGPAKADRKCKVQRWLDEISDETEGKAQLVAAVTTTDPASADYRTGDQIDKILYRLGLITSTKTIGDHRSGRCRCFA